MNICSRELLISIILEGQILHFNVIILYIWCINSNKLVEKYTIWKKIKTPCLIFSKIMPKNQRMSSPFWDQKFTWRYHHNIEWHSYHLVWWNALKTYQLTNHLLEIFIDIRKLSGIEIFFCVLHLPCFRWDIYWHWSLFVALKSYRVYKEHFVDVIKFSNMS